MYDIIIVGMGISGITAAIYAKRSNKKVILLDKGLPGGLLNSIDKVSNYPGLIDVEGVEFASILEQQIKKLEIDYKLEEVVELRLENEIKQGMTSKGSYEAPKVILAMGRKAKYLGLDQERDLLGKGLSTCATCDAYFYKGLDVAVVGTGNSALQESLYLSNIVNKVYILNRREGFRGDDDLVMKVKEKENIEILSNVTVKEMIKKDNKLDKVLLSNGEYLEVKGVFIYIGFRPATEIVPAEILDEEGYVSVNEHFESIIPGVYAIGDIVKKNVYQLVVAASDGAKVIYEMKN